MTFLEMQEAVLLDRFDERQRAPIKDAINSRYGRLWALEPWSFKRIIVEHSLLSGEDSVTLTDLGLQKVETVWSDLPSDLTRLAADRPELIYQHASTTSGTPYGFSIVGDTVYLDRPLSSNATLAFIGEAKWTPLVADGESPLIPAEYHMAIVAGAAADMLLREADPTWQGEEKLFVDQVNEMKLSYMSNLRMAQTAYPSWPY